MDEYLSLPHTQRAINHFSFGKFSEKKKTEFKLTKLHSFQINNWKTFFSSIEKRRWNAYSDYLPEAGWTFKCTI